MKLKKCLKITKSELFNVFVYPHGHVRERRGSYEAPVEIFVIERNETGKVPKSKPLRKYSGCKVKEIVPCGSHVNLVIEKTVKDRGKKGMNTANEKERRITALQLIMGQAAELNECQGVNVYFCIQGNTGCVCLTVEENKSQVYQRREFTTNGEGLWDMLKDVKKMLRQKEGRQ